VVARTSASPIPVPRLRSAASVPRIIATGQAARSASISTEAGVSVRTAIWAFGFMSPASISST
jgi:hypothetical protein